jgi:integrase
MIHKPAGRRHYSIKFMWKGRLVQKRTRATSARDARQIQAKLKSELARGNWGILESKPAPSLGEFLKRDFLPFVESRFRDSKPKTSDYYGYGASLLESHLAEAKIDAINDQHASQFAARHGHLSRNTVNCGLRTLRRALSSRCRVGKARPEPKITLAKGENQRQRVLSEQEAMAYLKACPQPWRDVATLMLGSGICPGEAFSLRWEHVTLNGHGGIIRVTEGKTAARKRPLPMVPAVYQALQTRHADQAYPADGWVFPAASRSGHLQQGSAKNQHAAALKASRVRAFPPYVLRHTALTRIAPHCDAWTLAKVAGHSSISITMRYIHPQGGAIERAFQSLAEGMKSETLDERELVTDAGCQQNLLVAGEESRTHTTDSSVES